jgi:hypothetical protein
MDTGEVVRCAGAGCKKQAYVKIEGTMPARWFGAWIPAARKTIRCCSETCLASVKNQYEGIDLPSD